MRNTRIARSTRNVRTKRRALSRLTIALLAATGLALSGPGTAQATTTTDIPAPTAAWRLGHGEVLRHGRPAALQPRPHRLLRRPQVPEHLPRLRRDTRLRRLQAGRHPPQRPQPAGLPRGPRQHRLLVQGVRRHRPHLRLPAPGRHVRPRHQLRGPHPAAGVAADLLLRRGQLGPLRTPPVPHPRPSAPTST